MFISKENNLFKEKEVYTKLEGYIDKELPLVGITTTSPDVATYKTIEKSFELLFLELNTELYTAHGKEISDVKACKKINELMSDTLLKLRSNFSKDAFDVCEEYASTRVYELCTLYPRYEKHIDTIRLCFNETKAKLGLIPPADIVEASKSYNQIYNGLQNFSSVLKLPKEYIIHSAELLLNNHIYLPLKKEVNDLLQEKATHEDNSNTECLASNVRFRIYHIKSLLCSKQ